MRKITGSILLMIFVCPIRLLQKSILVSGRLADKLVPGYLGHLYGLCLENEVQFFDADGISAEIYVDLSNIALIREPL
jgi:hypothetical protein